MCMPFMWFGVGLVCCGIAIFVSCCCCGVCWLLAVCVGVVFRFLRLWVYCFMCGDVRVACCVWVCILCSLRSVCVRLLVVHGVRVGVGVVWG